MNKFFTSTSAKTFLTATVLMLLMVFSNQVNAQNCGWVYHPGATPQTIPCNNTEFTRSGMGNGAYQHFNGVNGWPYYASTNIAKHLTVYDDQPGWTAQTNGNTAVAWTSRSSNANGNFVVVQNNSACPGWQAGATSAVLSVRTNFTVPNAMSGAETVCSGATQSAIYATGFNGNVSAFTFDWYYVDGTANPSAGGYIYAGTIVGNNGAVVTPTSVTRSWNCYFYPTGNSGCFAGWSTAYITKTVYPAWSAGSITGGAGTICPGAAAGTLTAAPSGGNGSNTIDWYWKPGTSAPSTGGYVYSGTTATSYSPGAIYSTRTYQAYITGGAGCGAGWTSNAITVTVTPPIGAGATSADQTLCNTSSPAALTSLGVAQGGNSAYTYTWQSSTDNSTFGTASGTTNLAAYTPPNTVGTNYYRRSVVDGSGCFSAVNTGTAATLGFVNMNSNVTSTALGTIQKVAGNGVGDGWDGGSGGTARIGPGGYIEARAGTTSAYMMFGLDASDPDYNYNSIDYAMYLNFGTSCIYENGGSPSCPGVAYTTSDVFRVYWNPSTNRIDYMKNGTTFYTSTVVPTSTVYVPDMSIYTVNGSMTNMAVKGDDNATIVVYQNPGTAAAGADKNTCALAAVAMTGNAIAAGTGTWSVVSGGTGTFANANSPTTNFTPTSYGAITLRWTFPANGSCAGSSDDVIINSYQSPGTAAAGGDQNTCALAAVTLAGNAIAVGTGTWSVVSGGTGTFSNANLATSTFTPTSYGAITLRWTFPANGTCAGSSDDVIINSYQAPGTAAAGGDQNSCALAAVTLAGNAIAVGTATWTVISGGTGTFSNANLATSTFTPTSYGAITLRWTFPTNGSCVGSSDDVIINSYQNPGTAAAGGDQNTCALAAVTLAGNAIAGPNAATWTVVSGGTGTFSNANLATSTFTPTSYGAITLRWTFPTNGTCAGSSDDVIINSYQNPGTATVGATQYRCGTLVSLALGGNAIATGTATWTIVSGGTGTFSNANSGSSTFTATGGYGTYVLRWSFPANGTCPASSADITVNYVEQATVGATPQTAPCNTLTSSALGGNTPNAIGTGAWSVVSGPGSVTWNPTINTPGATATVTTYGSYTFRWTITNVSAGCNTAADIVVNYNQTTVVTGSSSICDQDINVQYNSSVSGVTWSVFSGTGSIGAVNGQYTPGNIATPTQTSAVVIRATNVTCPTDFNVTVYNKAQLYDVALGVGNGIGNQCSGSIITLGSDVNGVTMSGTGVTGGPYPIPGYSWTAPTPASSSQNYTLTLTNGPSGCGDAATVTVYKAFTLTPATNPSVCDNSTVPFTSSVSATQWSVFSGTGSMSNSAGATSTYTPANIATPTQSTPTVITASNGVCEVSRTVTNYNDNTITTANNTAVCDGSTLTVNGDVSTVTWTFTSSLTGTAVTGPTQNTTLTPGNVATPTAQSSITVTATNGACVAKSITVLVDNQNTIAEAAGTYGLCDAAGATTMFTGDVNGTVWSSGTPATATVGTPATNGVVTPVNLGLPTQNATTVITATNGTCTPVTRTVRVDNDNSISTAATTICETATNFAVNGDVTATVWSANAGSVTTPGINTSFNPPNVSNPSANQAVTITATNGACTPKTVVITVDNQPGAPAGGADKLACGSLSVALSGTAPSSGVGTWTQSSGPGTITFSSANSNTPTATATATATGTYILQWTASTGVCASASDPVQVIYDPALTQTAVPDDCLNMSTDDFNTATVNYYVLVGAGGGTPPYSFPVTDLVGVVSATSQVYEQLDGSTVTYPVTDLVGCTAGGSFNVSVPSGLPSDLALSTWTGPGTASTTKNCYDFGYNKWVTYRDGNNDAILAINAATNDLGLVTVSMYRNDNEPVVLNSSWSNGSCYQVPMRPMERHFVVTTSNAPPVNGYAPKAKVRLFFTQTELSDLITETYGVGGSSNWDVGCSTEDDVTGIADLFVTKYTAPTGQLATEDGDYSNNLPAQNGGIYRLFGDALTLPGNTALTRVPTGFNTIYGGTAAHYVEMSVTEFSEFWLHGSGQSMPLPVQMIFLEANPINNAFIQLTWATALEINNDGFQVERSVDGQTWAQIGFVNGHDNATTQNDYSYNDMNVTAGIVYYYRLKQVDNDGAFEYTDIVSAQLNGDVTFSVKDFVPNPTMDKTSLIVTATKDQDITVTFYNVVGQKVMESSHLLNKGGNTITFDLNKLASGTYTAIVSSANEVYTKKVVLTK